MPKADGASSTFSLLADSLPEGLDASVIRFRFNDCDMAAVSLDDWSACGGAEQARLRRLHVAGRLSCRGEVFVLLAEDPADPDGRSNRSIAQVLTHRELRVACLIGEGMTDKEIARSLGISAYTVREHCRRACAKLGISKRSALVKRLFAMRGQDGPAPG